MRLLHMKIPQVSDEKRKLAIFRKCCLTRCWQGTQRCKRPHSEWTEGQMTRTMLCPNFIISFKVCKLSTPDWKNFWWNAVLTIYKLITILKIFRTWNKLVVWTENNLRSSCDYFGRMFRNSILSDSFKYYN